MSVPVLLTEDLHRVVCATAPGSIGNFGPGFDIIGCAITGPRDAVEARFTKTAGVNVAVAGHPELPTDPKLHASAIAVRKVLSMAGRDECGITLTVTKQLPLSGGQGGSAASAVAGALAVNALLGFPLDHDALLLAALHAESTLAGRHLDNVASALLGGIVLVRGIDPPEVIRLPVPRELRIALVLPQQRLRTVDARAVLPREVSRDVALTQAANVATLLHALHTGDLELLGRAMNDQIAEPARAPLLPGFIEAKRAAMRAGALGCSISGAGPTAFALAADDANAERLVDAMSAAYKSCGVAASGRVARIDERGASVEADDTAAV